MAKLWVLLVVMVVCLSQTYLAARIVRNADTSESQSSDSDSSSNEISENKEQTTLTEKDMVRIRKANITEADYRRVKDIYRDVKEWTPAAFATTLSKVCEILNPDLKESAVNVTPEQQVYFGKFVERTRAEVVDSDKILFAVSDAEMSRICEYSISLVLSFFCTIIYRKTLFATICTTQKVTKTKPKTWICLWVNTIVF